MKKILYLTPGERLVLDAVFDGAKEVEVKGNGSGSALQLRVGLANGTLADLLTRIESVVTIDAGVFLTDVMTRLIRAGILVQHGTRKDTELVGVLQVLVPREEIVVHDIETRQTKKVPADEFSTLMKCFDLLRPGATLQKFIRETLKVPEEKVHAWACRLVPWGVAENVSTSKRTDAAEWLAVDKSFPLFNFVADKKPEEEKASAKAKPVAAPVQKPVAPKVEAVKPKPEPVVAIEPRKISLAEAIVFLAGRREEIKSYAMSDRAMTVAEMEKIKNLLAEEKKRLAEAITNGVTFDNALYNSLVEKGRHLENLLARPDETELLKAYDAVVAELTEAFDKTHAFAFSERSMAVKPKDAAPPATKPETAPKPVEKSAPAPKATGKWKSKFGLNCVHLAAAALVKQSVAGNWHLLSDIAATVRQFEWISNHPLGTMMRRECRVADGLFVKRDAKPEERKGGVYARTQFVYKLTERGAADGAKFVDKLGVPSAEPKKAVVEKKTKRARRRKVKNGKLCLSERIAKNWAGAPSPLPNETLVLKDVRALVTANGEAGFKDSEISWGMGRRPDLFQKALIPVEEGQKRKRGFSTYKYKLTPKALKRFGVKK